MEPGPNENQIKLFNAKELKGMLRPYLPLSLGANTYRMLLGAMPSILLPGGKRRYYDLAEVIQNIPQVLRRLHGVPDIVVAAEPSLHRRRPRTHLAAG